MSTEPFIEGGYPYQFVDKPLDLFICKICQLVSQDPYETLCCHNTFCKLCIDTAEKHEYKSCPICRCQPIQTTKSVQLRRQIENLQVFCNNKEAGCEWVGEVERVEGHMKLCPYYMLNCEYHIVGCNVKIPRHLQNEHNAEKAKDHIFMVQQKVEELNNTKVTLNQANDELNSNKQELKRSKALLDVATVELQHAKARLHDTIEKWDASKRELYNTNKKLNDTIDQLAYSQKERNDIQRKLADSEDEVNHTIKALLCSNQKLENTEGELALVVSSLKQIKNHVKSNSYEAIKLVAVSTKIPSEARMIPTVFKLSQYTEKKEKNLPWYSGPFYTDVLGYKMCLIVSPGGDGDGKGTHLSVALCLMNGQHDDHLVWPLREKFKISLLNQQLKDDKHHSRVITYDDSVDNKIAGRVIGDGRVSANKCTQFISHSKITSACHFLKDDCLYFEVQTYRSTAIRTSACKYIFICSYYLIFWYFTMLFIGMLFLQ